MKRIILILTILCGVIATTKAQQLPLFTQYYKDPILYNPSFAGLSGNINASLIHREQWSSIPDAPNTSAFTIDAPFSKKKIGIGLGILHDQAGMFNKLQINSYYRYQLDLSDENKLNFGLMVGFLNNSIDFSKANVKDKNDPYLLNGIQQKSGINADFGVTYVWNKVLQLGISVPQLIGDRLHYRDNETGTYYELKQQFQFSAKYLYTINEEKRMSIYPLVLLRYTANAPFQFDANVVFDWKKYGWAALSYSFQNALGFNLGVYVFDNLQAGYSYGLTVGKLNGYTGNTNEIYLGYTFGSTGKKSLSNNSDADWNLLKSRIDSNSKRIDSLALLHKNASDIYKNPTGAKYNSGDLNGNIGGSMNQNDSSNNNSNNSANSKKGNGSSQAGSATGNNTKTNNSPVDQSQNKKVRVVQDKGQNYYVQGQVPPAASGYYVVLGAFAVKNNAVNFRDMLKLRGFDDAKWIYKSKMKIYDVYVDYVGPGKKQDAINKVEQVRGEYPKAWILSLTK